VKYFLKSKGSSRATRLRQSPHDTQKKTLTTTLNPILTREKKNELTFMQQININTSTLANEINQIKTALK
jgi:hypothetical protein